MAGWVDTQTIFGFGRRKRRVKWQSVYGWCDFQIQERIKGIEGVAWVEQEDIPDHCHVYYDARYNLEDIVKEMRALAGE